ncbi:MAG: glycosyltransferase family 2 protein [Bacteroidales bacterium]
MYCACGKEKKYLIIIPAYNEENTLEGIISALHKYSSFADILVVDDGSEDQTPIIVKNLENILSIRHNKNTGYGSTLIEGFNYAIENGYEYAITIDGDNQHNPDEIDKFIQANEKNQYDIISGSRYYWISQNNHPDAPGDRKKVNYRITKKINELTNYNLTDAFCGFKLYRVQALRNLNLTEPGYAIPLQLWIEAYMNDLRIMEIPVEMIYLDHNKGVAMQSTWMRYRYYLNIINKTINKYETSI